MMGKTGHKYFIFFKVFDVCFPHNREGRETCFDRVQKTFEATGTSIKLIIGQKVGGRDAVMDFLIGLKHLSPVNYKFISQEYYDAFGTCVI